MRETTVQIVCDASGDTAEPVDLGVMPEDAQEIIPTDLPEGWLALTLTRTVPNPAKSKPPPEPLNQNDPDQVFGYMQARAEFDAEPDYVLQDLTLTFSPAEAKQALVGVPTDVLEDSEFGDLA